MDIPPKAVLRAKPSGRSRWACGFKATHANPEGGYSKGQGPTEPARFYVCDLQSCPFARSFHGQGCPKHNENWGSKWSLAT